MSYHNALFCTVLAIATTATYSLTLPSTIAYQRAEPTVATHETNPVYTPLLVATATHVPLKNDKAGIDAVNTEALERDDENETNLVPVALNTLEQDQGALPENETTDEPITPPATVVPFYSQFADISSKSWQKVGCGIASLAMIIDYYGEVDTVDKLLNEGINAGAYIDSAGWSHAGLISLANKRGLTGESITLSGITKDEAFEKLQTVVAQGPVMVSVHYTFEPTNPIPHLAVITGIEGDTVYYNDPAEPSGGGSITAAKFKAAWKQRYIQIRPTS